MLIFARNVTIFTLISIGYTPWSFPIELEMGKRKGRRSEVKRFGGQVTRKETVEELKRQIAKLKKESSAKLKQIELELESREKELQSLKERLGQKEAELLRLGEQMKYKDQKLASKDIEIDTYKKITEEKIFQLEAKVKQYEAKVRKRSIASR